jgi:cytochrome c oxidase cbb3-type subunit III
MRPRAWVSACLGLIVGVSLSASSSNQAAATQTPAAPAAQQPVEPPKAPPAHGRDPEEGPPPFPAHQRPPAPPEVIERGKTNYASLCSACHGADGRGGQLGGVNLLRSALVLGDRDGELVLPVIKKGRPGTAMVAIPISDENAKAVVAYIHSLQAEGSQQGGPPPGPPVVLNIVVGDPRAGSAYFTANCSTCHSTTGDLAGVAGRVEDAKALQNLWVSGGRTTGAGGHRHRGGPSTAAITTVKVTLPNEVVEGALARVDDFLVTVRLADGTVRSIRREGDTPKIEITNPLARHDALLGVYTNKNVQDVTAFLATLK